MKFSVVIPMYNTALYVEATVRGVLAQEYADFEVIVVNDGSTDGCEKVVAAIGDLRIRIINKPNTGVSDTRNVGCREAKGEYIAFLDSDDYWYPDHLSEAAKFFEQYPEVKWYGARHFTIPFGSQPPTDLSNTLISLRNYFVDGKGYVHSTSLIIRRDVFTECGGYPVDMKYFEDYYFQGKVASRYPILGCNERVTSIYYKKRPGSATVKLPSPLDLLPAYRRALQVFTEGVTHQGVKAPLWPLSVMRLFLRSVMFHVPKNEIMRYLAELRPLAGRLRIWRWRFFLTVAYGLQSANLSEDLKRMVQLTAKNRFFATLDILRRLGFAAAGRWALIVLHYSFRGAMDMLQDRIERCIFKEGVK